jgi:manganese oxidase
MGDQFPNLIGVDTRDVDRKLQPLLPGYMTMGREGMADHGEHIAAGHVKAPKNSIPMLGGPGPFDAITMGGLFTVLKVREELPAGGRDPGWYRHPEGTVASRATRDDLRRDGIEG